MNTFLHWHLDNDVECYGEDQDVWRYDQWRTALEQLRGKRERGNPGKSELSASGFSIYAERTQGADNRIRIKEGSMDFHSHQPSFACVRNLRARLLAGLVLLLAPLLAWSQAADLRPVVFVHGSSGSAAQFETQAMRFTSAGYPQQLLFAFEYDTSVSTNGEQIDLDLDAFIDGVRSRTGAETINVAAHSRGTTVMHRYLSEPQQAAKVARYVNIDGRTAATPPGGVPTLALWGEWNPVSAIGGAVNLHYSNKAHTELATSAEGFAAMYEFFTGAAPETTDVVPEPPGLVQISGRATIFPVNVVPPEARCRSSGWTPGPVRVSTTSRLRRIRSTRPVAGARSRSTDRSTTSSR